ncbi:MAG: chemotaxis-specific protein-glutamate methyltransferase CheB [Treponema sp.]|jgi:two-component system chemotaxis response regulator CheB|nr:chemotaxis-specific protein-glutamate methyltransferase CheB [Treponema sp.]
MIRVLIVDDSPLTRTILRDFFERDEQFRVIGEAGDGLEAIQKTHDLNPDLITMDIEMPVMSGLEAMHMIMKDMPTPIVVISVKSNAKTAYEATVQGALEFYSKDIFTPSMDEEQRLHIYKTLKRISRIKRKRVDAEHTLPLAAGKIKTHPLRAVVIAASTGGPKALMQIFSGLPADFPVPVITVQHNSSGFDKGFVHWMREYTPLEICLAEDQIIPRKGKIYIAPTDKHLIIQGGHLALIDGEPVQNQKPAADMLFKSAARALGQGVISVVLTGMGSDGAEGTVAIRKAGGITIAQDEASALIYGMPKSALETGCVDMVLPLQDIPYRLIALATPLSSI